MISRRAVLGSLGAGMLVVRFGAFAQPQGKVWRVGIFTQRGRPDSHFKAFREGMRELGYVEGKNLALEWRYDEGRPELLPAMAEELVRLKVDVILTSAGPVTRAVQKATTVIPIVMASVGDPVGMGLIKSLARPGGNITGLSNFNLDLSGKRLEMLRAMTPKLERIGVLINSENPSGQLLLKQLQVAVQVTGVKVLQLNASAPQDIDNAFASMAKLKAGALIVGQDPFLITQRQRIAALALKQHLPSISGYREYTESGGLMSYGQNIADNYRRAAAYIDKIFKGAKPGGLPVEQPTVIELIINGKTAKLLGLKIPQTLLISANKVIE